MLDLVCVHPMLGRVPPMDITQYLHTSILHVLHDCNTPLDHIILECPITGYLQCAGRSTVIYVPPICTWLSATNGQSSLYYMLTMWEKLALHTAIFHNIYCYKSLKTIDVPTTATSKIWFLEQAWCYALGIGHCKDLAWAAGGHKPGSWLMPWCYWHLGEILPHH
jgi:hypothetical protein